MQFNMLLTKKQIRVFIISLVAVFLMVVIPKLGFTLTMVSPVSQKIDILEKIKPKLYIKQNNYQLKTTFIPQHQLIPTALAGAEYEEAKAYGVIDYGSGEVLASKNFSKELPMASLTKIMTAVVALDLANLDDIFTVSELAEKQIPTKVMLRKGEKFTLEELLHSLLLSSANDSAEVIKEGVDDIYGQEVFMSAMNAKAQILGLKNTHFINPQGFDGQSHYSSIEDLAILSHYALEQYPEVSGIVEKEFADYTKGFDKRFYLNNWNGLLGVYPGTSGIKIGNTEKAGQSTIVLSEREGKKVLVVLLGAPGVLERDLWAAELLDLGFANFELPSVNITALQLKEKYAAWKYF